VRFLVNGEPVKRGALAGRPQKELGKRVVWTVYFEADPGTAFGDIVYGIDAIQGLEAEVIWITPKMREEWRAAGWPSPEQTAPALKRRKVRRLRRTGTPS
jgi:hypothetical protein